jgi:hypothetical protein
MEVHDNIYTYSSSANSRILGVVDDLQLFSVSGHLGHEGAELFRFRDQLATDLPLVRGNREGLSL